MAKKAVLIGINYPGTEAELKGCINDAVDMRDLLVEVFGFSMEDIKVLLDDKPPEDSGLSEDEIIEPTGENIRKALNDLVEDVSPGDILFIHYSGHGTQVPADKSDLAGADQELDNYDEALCPSDMNLILDDDLKEIFRKIPKGVNLTFVADCCHSGTMLDHTTIAIGDGGAAANPLTSLMALLPGIAGFRDLQDRDKKIENDEKVDDDEEDDEKNEEEAAESDPTKKKRRRQRVLNRNLSLASVAQILGGSTGNDVVPGEMRHSLKNIFGENASQTILNYVAKIQDMLANKIPGGESIKNESSGGAGGIFGKLCGCFSAATGGKTDNGEAEAAGGPAGMGGPAAMMGFLSQLIGPGKINETNKLDDDIGILISGCQDKQTSADIRPKPPKKPHGALTATLTAALRKNAEETEDDSNPVTLTYRELVTSLNSVMDESGMTQDPGLCSSEQNADLVFLSAIPVSSEEEQPQPEPEQEEKEEEEEEEEKKGKKGNEEEEEAKPEEEGAEPEKEE